MRLSPRVFDDFKVDGLMVVPGLRLVEKIEISRLRQWKLGGGIFAFVSSSDSALIANLNVVEFFDGFELF